MAEEPVVRIRCTAPEDAARCRAILAGAGLSLEESLTFLVVREADPDRVNDLLVAGGAHGRAVAREQVGRLLAWLLDHGADLAGRGPTLLMLVKRALSEAGLSDRYAPRPEPELLTAAAALHEELLATAGGFIPWEAFTAAFCTPRARP